MRPSSRRLWKTLRMNSEYLLPIEVKHEWRPVLSLRETSTGARIPIAGLIKLNKAKRKKDRQQKRKFESANDGLATRVVVAEADTWGDRRTHKGCLRMVVSNEPKVVRLLDLWKSYKGLMNRDVYVHLDEARKRKREKLQGLRELYDGEGPPSMSLSLRRSYLAQYGTAWWERRWDLYDLAKKDEELSVLRYVILKGAYFARWKVACAAWKGLRKELGRIPDRKRWGGMQSSPQYCDDMKRSSMAALLLEEKKHRKRHGWQQTGSAVNFAKDLLRCG